MVDEPMFDSLRRWTKAAGMIGDIPIESTLGALDEAGVDRAMICAWSSPRGALITNDEVAAFVAAAPERLVGVASVDLRRPMEGVRELRRCVRELGFKALRMLPWLWELPPDDRRYYPLYAE
jgi:predicted TIM-barrel fold metal-dependent hydrolase